MDIKNLVSLREFQQLNAWIYVITNDRHYTTCMMAEKLERYCTLMLKLIRKNDLQKMGPHLALTFSWAMAIGNRLHIDIEDRMWMEFPGRCPYCGFPKCDCPNLPDRPKERIPDLEPHGEKPRSLEDFQKMFVGIYFYNTLRDAGTHLAEEAAELAEALEHYAARHESATLEEIKTELVDVVTNILAVASAAEINLTKEIIKIFIDGCVKCKKVPCNCSYVVINSMVGSVMVGD